MWQTHEGPVFSLFKMFPNNGPETFVFLGGCGKVLGSRKSEALVLASLHDPAAARVLAQGLTDCQARDVAGQALVALGPAAEDAVIPFLRSADERAQMAACWILAEIGTEKSLEPLKDAMNSNAWNPPFVKEGLTDFAWNHG
jgi:hypothetical protein